MRGGPTTTAAAAAAATATAAAVGDSNMVLQLLAAAELQQRLYLMGIQRQLTAVCQYCAVDSTTSSG
jgi:hypothetical protein